MAALQIWVLEPAWDPRQRDGASWAVSGGGQGELGLNPACSPGVQPKVRLRESGQHFGTSGWVALRPGRLPPVCGLLSPSIWPWPPLGTLCLEANKVRESQRHPTGGVWVGAPWSERVSKREKRGKDERKDAHAWRDIVRNEGEEGWKIVVAKMFSFSLSLNLLIVD